MCDNVLVRLAEKINTVADVTLDVIPSILLFSGTDCVGLIYPTLNGDLPNNDSSFPVGTTDFPLPIFPGLNGAGPPSLYVQSLYIPPQYTEVTLYSGFGGTGHSFVAVGPWAFNDLSLEVYDNTSISLTDPANRVKSIKVLSANKLDWITTELPQACMGSPLYISYFPLTRYQPQSDRCDEFMTNDFCPNHIGDVRCSCFEDQAVLEAKSEKLGVILPAICFGANCATKTSYKTSKMLQSPCNMIICQQIIRESPGIFNSLDATLFCNGKFFQQDTNLVVPTVTPFSAVSAASSTADQPFYLWLILGISGLLFIVFSVLMFLNPPKIADAETQLRALKELKARRAEEALERENASKLKSNVKSSKEHIKLKTGK